MTANTFEELERRCKRLRYRKFFKLFISLLLLLAVAFFVYYYLVNFKDRKILHTKEKVSVKQEKKLEKNITKEIVKPLEKKVEIKKEEPPLKKKIEKSKKSVLVLQPKIEINASMIESEKIAQEQKSKKSVKSIKKPAKITPPKEEVIKKVEPAKKKIDFKIKLTNSDEETILIKNYKVNKSYDAAIKLSRYYFSKKRYKKAIYWAKIASKFDATKASPWLIYAKSKYSLGKKREAMEVLRTFLSYFYSKEAFDLLEEYKKR